MILKASHSRVIETSFLRPIECPREKDLSYYLLTVADGRNSLKKNQIVSCFHAALLVSTFLY
jgi:hypothetical protein